MKKLLSLGLIAVLAVVVLAGCGGAERLPAENGNGETDTMRGLINVVTREDGSGTRTAFIDMLGIEDIWDEANVQNGTSAVINTVAGSNISIGYSSLGSIEGNNTVRAITIDGVAPTAANIRSGAYPISRNFSIVTTTELSDAARDFIDFIFSIDGTAIVDNSYIAAVPAGTDFEVGNVSGTIVVGGSTSVAPLVTELARAYMELNGDVRIEVQPLGSSAGINGAIEGTFDIGLTSRPMTAAELADASETVIAVDGIAVIVPASNPLVGLTVEQVANIFTGAVERWEEL